MESESTAVPTQQQPSPSLRHSQFILKLFDERIGFTCKVMQLSMHDAYTQF